MTDQQIYNLLIRIDDGYEINENQLQVIERIEKLNWKDITILPKSMRMLNSLSRLELPFCKDLTDITALYGMTSITYLNLAMCIELSDISALSSLTNLENLNLSGCDKLSDISALSNLKNLTYLNLSWDFNISNVNVLADLTSINHLNLSYTQVHEIDSLLKLKSLNRLDLSGLKLSTIPEFIIELGLNFYFDRQAHGHGIYINDLALSDQPIEIFYQSREAITEYYRSNKETAPVNECKVVFLGDGGVGKSYIINRIMNDGNHPNDFKGDSTPGICINSKKYMIDGEEIELHFWDFGGQEIMHSMHRLFLTNRTLYVVVVNARDNKANDQAWYWIRNIKSFANDVPVLLVVNQKDQNPSANVNRTGLEKEYPQLRSIKVISALNDSQEVFNIDICKEICYIVSTMETVHTPFAKSWLSLMNDLQDMEDDYIQSTEFYKKCRYNGIVTHDPKVLDSIINWYQDLGVCFYSKKHPTSRQYMVLKPRWILNAIYILIFNGRQYASNGIISELDIDKLICASDVGVKKVWSDIEYNPFEVQYIINVLLNYNLVFRLDQDRFFIPMLCDENEPSSLDVFENDDSFHISFVYTYLPENILHRLMVRYGAELNKELVWRTGAVFERNSNGWRALVRIKDNHLDVYVKALDQAVHPANSYLEMIREAVYESNNNLGLSAQENIYYRRNGLEESFNYKALVGSKKAGITVIYSIVFDRAILIDEILGIIRNPYNRMTKDVIDLMISSLKKMSERCTVLEKRGEIELTGDFQDSITSVLNNTYDIQIAREYTLGRALKELGETDLYFFCDKKGIKTELYILENKAIENFEMQYKQLMGYLNPNFKAGFTLSINKTKGWEEAFDYIYDKLDEMKRAGGEFTPVVIDRKAGNGLTEYIKSEHVVPETGMMMPVYHLVMQLSDASRQKIAKEARKR